MPAQQANNYSHILNNLNSHRKPTITQGTRATMHLIRVTTITTTKVHGRLSNRVHTMVHHRVKECNTSSRAILHKDTMIIEGEVVRVRVS
jgi:hypothetical protein